MEIISHSPFMMALWWQAACRHARVPWGSEI